jgi:hypothetical protein
MVYFQTKNPNLGKSLEGITIEDVGIFYEHSVYFKAAWYMLYSVVIWYIFPFLVCHTKKNQATLVATEAW